MSVQVYEIAGALHKGTKQVLEDLQRMGEPVKKIYDEVSDQAIYTLAKEYDRADYVLQLLSNEYIHELEKAWDERELVKLFPEVDWTKSFLSTKEAERILILKDYLPSLVETVENQGVTANTAKIVRALHLVGNDGKAILVPKQNRDLEIFLIPKGKKDTSSCCICFDQKKILHADINVEECMILVWADGSYFYEAAPFTKMNGRYYLELHKFLEEKGIKQSQFSEIHWSKKGIWDMAKYVLPGKSGFAMQDKSKCTLKIDQEKLLISGGSVETLFWKGQDSKMTIKGQLTIKNIVRQILETSGEMDDEQLKEIEDLFKKAFEECMKNSYTNSKKGKPQEIPKLYKDSFEEQRKEEFFDLAVEAYMRLRIMQQQGFPKEVAETFANSRNIFMGKEKGGIVPLKDHYFMRKIKNFERTNRAVAYFCMLFKTKEGKVAAIFYVSEKKEKWEKERKDLMQGQVKVHFENMSRKDRSKAVRVQFHITNGGIELHA